MKLLKEIIDLLMNESGSLNEALLKTKVLLHKIGQRELVGWVNNELTGYEKNEEVPQYRRVGAQVFGNITNGVRTYPNRPLPTQHLTETQRKFLESEEMRQGLGVLERFVAGSTAEGSLVLQLGPEFDVHFGKVFSGGYHVEGAYSHIGMAEVQQILIEVRSRLLDFILALQDTIGTDMTDEDVKNATAGIDIKGMLDGAVFGNGPVTIMVGHNGQQHVHNTNVKHDADALAAELRKNGVAEEDIEALNAAIAEDPAPTTTGQYGPAVKAWMSSMLSKAVDTTWKISISAAGGVLAGAVKSYYGM
jgi:hypothetical protein